MDYSRGIKYTIDPYKLRTDNKTTNKYYITDKHVCFSIAFLKRYGNISLCGEFSSRHVEGITSRPERIPTRDGRGKTVVKRDVCTRRLCNKIYGVP